MSDSKRQDLMRCLIAASPRRSLNRTQLVKLVFLADYEHYETFGHTITDLSYSYEELGPFTWDIPNGAKETEGITYTERRLGFWPGHREYRYELEEQAADMETIGLSPEEANTAVHVIREYGWLSARQLVQLLHEDPFVDQFNRGGEIDFSLLDPDPLEDEEVQADIHADEELYESMRRAEAQVAIPW